jgi:hypothetical protein
MNAFFDMPHPTHLSSWAQVGAAWNKMPAIIMHSNAGTAALLTLIITPADLFISFLLLAGLPCSQKSERLVAILDWMQTDAR